MFFSKFEHALSSDNMHTKKVSQYEIDVNKNKTDSNVKILEVTTMDLKLWFG